MEADEKAVKEWLMRRPEVASAADAGKAVDELNKLVAQYEARSWLANRGDAAAWRLQGRLAVADGLTALADAQYQTAIAMTLPLKPENTATAKATLRSLKEQIAALNADLKLADEYKAPLDKNARAAVDGKGAVAAEYAVREELLALFARPDLFTDAGGAEAWLRQVGERHRGTKDQRVHALIVQKVQEFCEAFIPPVAQLDDNVLLKSKPIPRKAVKVSFEETLGGRRSRRNSPRTRPGSTSSGWRRGRRVSTRRCSPRARSTN